jgi:hypothetical protein
MHIGIYLYFEILSLLFATYFYQKKRNKMLLYFIPFLFLTVAIEVIGGGWTSYSWFAKYRFAIYNVFTTIEFLFYNFLFYLHLKKKAFKKTILFFVPIFILLVIFNLTFIQGLNKTFHTYTFLTGSFFIVIFCCFFFYESVLPDKIDDQLSKQPFFWISSALLIYYLGSVIINALFDYLTTNDMRIEGIRIYGIINNSLNVILYSMFCIAFYLCPNNRKTYSSPS